MYLEIITIRSPQLRSVEGKIPDLLAALQSASELPPVAVYLRAPPTSDLSIHLHWPSLSERAEQPGFRLAAALMEFGTVDHALWESLRSSAPVDERQSNPFPHNP